MLLTFQQIHTCLSLSLTKKKKKCVGEIGLSFESMAKIQSLPPSPKKKKKTPPRSGGSLVSECFHRKEITQVPVY